MNNLTRAALAGSASGLRSFTGLAAVVLTARPNAPRQPDRFFARTWVKAGAGLLAVQELVMDKLPKTPSRLQLPGLGSRAVGGAACAVALARRDPETLVNAAPATADGEPDNQQAGSTIPVAIPPVLAATAVALAATLAASFLGLRFRTLAAHWFSTDLPGALIEDAAAAALGWLATTAP